MRIIVPMAGMGKRMRPHTLTTPKPLIPVAGKPIVQRLVEDLAAAAEGDGDGVRVERVGSKSVDGFGRERDDLAGAEERGGFADG